MPRMSMNKVIHGAIRRDLDRFVGALEQFPDADRQRAGQLGVAWENFHDQLTHHHEGEHEIAWPALEAVGVSRELLTTMDAEHETMATALDRAQVAMDALRADPTAGQAQTAASAMRELRAVTNEHLEHEEREVEEVYLDNRDSPPMQQMAKQFSRQGITRAGRFFAWISDGASEDERAAMSEDIPKPVLAVISGVFGRGYRRQVAPVWR